MSARRRVTVGLVLLVVGAVMFVVPGAWLYGRGAPWWASLAVALVLFPVAPVAWHLLGERARRRRLATAAATAKPGVKPRTSTLTGGDRFTMRMAAVVLLALGPLLFLRPGQTWRAVRAHPAWFVPRSPPAPPGPGSFAGDARLLAQVPADAALVVWARRLDGLGGDDAPAAGAVREPAAEEVLVAYRGGELMFVVRGPDEALGKLELDELNAQLGKQPWLQVRGPLVARRRGADLLVVVSQGWAAAADDRAAGRAGGPEALAARLAGAPDDAVVIAAVEAPGPVAGVAMSAMQAWLRVSKAAIRIDAEVVVPDRAAGDALVERMRAEERTLAARAPAACRPKLEALRREVVMVSGETSVRMRAWWTPEQVGEAMMCGLGALMRDADWK